MRFSFLKIFLAGLMFSLNSAATIEHGNLDVKGAATFHKSVNVLTENGFGVIPNADADAVLLSVGVTDYPELKWVEDADAFQFSKNLMLPFTVAGALVTNADGLLSSETLSISNGGTGQAEKAAAFNALTPTVTIGDMVVQGETGADRLAVGSSGQTLTVVEGVPAWTSPPVTCSAQFSILSGEITGETCTGGVSDWLTSCQNMSTGNADCIYAVDFWSSVRPNCVFGVVDGAGSALAACQFLSNDANTSAGFSVRGLDSNGIDLDLTCSIICVGNKN